MRGETCIYCGCPDDRPALEHNRHCVLRIEFFGGDAEWDTTKEYNHLGMLYAWDEKLGSWVVSEKQPGEDTVNASYL
jgi:hypothetical protein